MKLFSFILFFISGVYAQNFGELFWNELPREIQNNNAYLNQIANTLYGRSAIHPDLIYYTMEYINTDSSDSKKMRNLYLFTGKLSTDQNNSRNEWLRQQAEKTNGHEWNERVLETTRRFFLSHINETRKDNISSEIDNIHPDRNRLDYFAYKYYLLDASLTYSEETDYSALRSKLEKQYMSEMQGFSAGVPDPDESAEKIYRFWYLFKKNDVGLDANEIVLNIFNSNQQVSGSNLIYVFAGYGFWNSTYKFRKDYFIKEIDRTLNYENGLSSSQVSAGAGFLFNIRDHRSICSHIKIQAGYLAGKSTQNVDGDLQIYVISVNNDEKITRRADLDNLLKFESFNTFRIDVSTPIFFLTNSLFVEAGVSVNYNTMTYENNYSYTYQNKLEQYTMSGFRTVYDRRGTVSDITEKGTEKALAVRPVINIIFDLPMNFQALINGSYEYAVLNIGYAFSL